MTDPITRESERREDSILRVASALHEDWRKTRKKEDGSFEPRMKTTKDNVCIIRKGTDQVDIANTNFEDLPADWQKENHEAAIVVVDILNKYENLDLTKEETYNAVGDEIHKAWLTRNSWAAGGELDVPFVDLPQNEKDKDINQIIIAQKESELE